jgi:High potential iron-sulfur protein
MISRRKIIAIAPAGLAVAILNGCGQKAEAPAAPSPAAPPPAAPAPAPVAAAPAPAPAPASPAPAAPAATGAMVDEKDAQAVSLGYVADASKVDKAKFASYQAGQACSSCALYQGAAGSTAGGCGIFAGKQVAAAGWCSAYAKKA